MSTWAFFHTRGTARGFSQSNKISHPYTYFLSFLSGAFDCGLKRFVRIRFHTSAGNKSARADFICTADEQDGVETDELAHEIDMAFMTPPFTRYAVVPSLFFFIPFLNFARLPPWPLTTPLDPRVHPRQFTSRPLRLPVEEFN